MSTNQPEFHNSDDIEAEGCLRLHLDLDITVADRLGRRRPVLLTLVLQHTLLLPLNLHVFTHVVV